MSAFVQTVERTDPAALRALGIQTLMVNVGLRCDQACAHCHQSCSPARTEVMGRNVMDAVIAVADEVRPELVDLTGGAPELNPDIRYLLAQLSDHGHPVTLRTNLTALLTPEAEGLIDLLAGLEVTVLASFPATAPDAFATERGPVFERSLDALRALNEAGYGRLPGLRLDLAVNRRADAPALADAEIESQFRRDLTDAHGIDFNGIMVITNVPVGRFRERLEREGALASYLAELRQSFNPATLPHLACRSCIEIAWDGTLWDCDFNLGRGLTLTEDLPHDVFEFDASALETRPLRFAEHCFACTAGVGSG